jgi:hypothetical protein
MTMAMARNRATSPNSEPINGIGNGRGSFDGSSPQGYVHDDDDDELSQNHFRFSSSPIHGNGAGSWNHRKYARVLVVMVLFGALYFVLERSEKASIIFSGRNGIGTTSVLKLANQWGSNSSVESGLYTTANGDRTNLPARNFILLPNQEFFPRICWLMSYPNSGTSFTMTMTARASNKSFASNYGDEVTADDQMDSLSIYPRRPEGPYWTGLQSKLSSHPRELPEDYVMTKTHCGSRCINCGPDEYIETPEEFLTHCASGHARVSPSRKRVDVQYPPNRVAKAIHLIRNPFHNTIARFHLDHRHYERSKKTDWVEAHPNNAEGLRAWCQDLDDQYSKEDEAYFKDNAPEVLAAPCHGEFYKYTQWHNLVHESLALIEHDVPVLTVYYEDYSTKFNATAKEILNFLNLELRSEFREFQARTDYDGYFSKEQKEQIRRMIQKVASKTVWGQIQHYLSE